MSPIATLAHSFPYTTLSAYTTPDHPGHVTTRLLNQFLRILWNILRRHMDHLGISCLAPELARLRTTCEHQRYMLRMQPRIIRWHAHDAPPTCSNVDTLRARLACCLSIAASDGHLHLHHSIQPAISCKVQLYSSVSL